MLAWSMMSRKYLSLSSNDRYSRAESHSLFVSPVELCVFRVVILPSGPTEMGSGPGMGSVLPVNGSFRSSVSFGSGRNSNHPSLTATMAFRSSRMLRR